MKQQNRTAALFFTLLLSSILWYGSDSQAQLRRPGIITVKHEDRNKSNLIPEKGAVYLEGLVVQDVKIHITKTVPAYSNLTGQRWLGNIFGNQVGTLLAVSPKAYRVRAKAKQGQIAGWISKSAITGLPDGFEDKLVAFHQRAEMVEQLIDNKQVALGMTSEEVVASIGPPDTKSSHLDANGRKDIFQFVSYKRVPQTVIGYNQFGQAVPATRYIEVECGRVTIEFTNNLVSSISESEGLNFNRGIPFNQVPPFIPLF